MDNEKTETVKIRLVCHNKAKQWHDCTPGFVKNLENYLVKNSKRLDIWVQYYDGRRSITHPNH